MRIILPIIVLLLVTAARAGPACDNLAAAIKACGALNINATSPCLRAADQASNCRVLEGAPAAAAVMQPAWDAYIQRRIDQHKLIYGK